MAKYRITMRLGILSVLLMAVMVMARPQEVFAATCIQTCQAIEHVCASNCGNKINMCLSNCVAAENACIANCTR